VPCSVAIDEEIIRAQHHHDGHIPRYAYAPGVTALSTTERAVRVAGAMAIGPAGLQFGLQFTPVRRSSLECVYAI
jgi:hypothetical protein